MTTNSNIHINTRKGVHMKFIDVYYIHNSKKFEFSEDEKEDILDDANRRYKSLGGVLSLDLVSSVSRNVYRFDDARALRNVEWCPDLKFISVEVSTNGASFFVFVYK